MNLPSTAQQMQGESNLDQIDYSINQHAISAPDVPSVFTLELTTACNNFCSGCANTQLSRIKKDRKLSLVFMADWKTAIDKIAPFASIIRLSGGEPTLHPEFMQIVNYIESLSIPHSLFSTGLWSQSMSKNIIELYKKCNHFVGILISLHGSDSYAHNAFVENSDIAFKKTCQNIKTASESGLDVFTNTVLTKYNYDEIIKIIDFATHLGAKYSIFNRFLGKTHPIEPSYEQLKEAILEIEKLKRQGYRCRFGNNIPPCFVNNSSEGTKAGYTLCHIDPRGFIRPDNLVNLNFGNLYKDSLYEIWRSSIAILYRSSFPKTCLTCAAFSFCKAGAKSVTLQYGLQQDKLMRTPLDSFTPENDDEYKRSIKYLALTSD